MNRSKGTGEVREIFPNAGGGAGPPSSMHCVTHHFACKCREEEFAEKIAWYELKLARAQQVCNRDAERLVKLHDDNVDLRNEIAALKDMK